VRALLIPAFGPVEEVQQNGLNDLRRLVDGHIEALPSTAVKTPTPT
jgi:hypothetical protein